MENEMFEEIGPQSRIQMYLSSHEHANRLSSLLMDRDGTNQLENSKIRLAFIPVVARKKNLFPQG